MKNGMLGTIEAVEPHAIHIRLDGGTRNEASRQVTVRPETYQSVDHGYATTIHKTQGATVDRAFVLASATMDRHLTYVAMTRHRDGVSLYGSQAEFRSWRQFEERLSRSGLRETVFDYAVDFAERRGIAEALGVTSEIKVQAQPSNIAEPLHPDTKQELIKTTVFDFNRISPPKCL